MSAESGSLTTEVGYTANLVAADHHGKHRAIGDDKNYPTDIL